MVGAKEAETECVGRWVGAAANSGERTRTPATGRALASVVKKLVSSRSSHTKSEKLASRKSYPRLRKRVHRHVAEQLPEEQKNSQRISRNHTRSSRLVKQLASRKNTFPSATSAR